MYPAYSQVIKKLITSTLLSEVHACKYCFTITQMFPA